MTSINFPASQGEQHAGPSSPRLTVESTNAASSMMPNMKDTEIRRLLAARRFRSTLTSKMLSLTVVTALLITCCGCPPRPPSQEQQRAGTPSCWITVEPTTEATGSKLNTKDAEAIIAQLPSVSAHILERVYSATIRSENSQAAAEVCGTEPSCLRLLQETTRTEVTAGRFLEAADSEEAASVIVLDELLAEKLFAETDPIGRNVTIGQQTWTNIGVVTQPHSGRTNDFTKDAYLPRESFSDLPPGATEESPASLDRIRVRVDSLDQVEHAKAILRAIVHKRHPDQTFMVH